MPKRLVRSLCFVVMSACQILVHAQNSPTVTSQGNPPAHKDPAALSIVSRSLSVMGGAQWSGVSDFQVTGHTTSWRGIPQNRSLTISGRSTGEYRFNLGKTDSEPSYIATTKADKGQYVKGTDTVKVLPFQIALSDGIYFPLPLLFDAVTNPHISLSYKGSSLVEGVVTDSVEITQIFPSEGDGSASHFNHFTTRTLFFDSTSGNLTKISYYVYSDKNANSKLERSINFSSYIVQQGILYPSEIQEHQRSQLLNVILLENLAVNTGLPDNSFHLSN